MKMKFESLVHIIVHDVVEQRIKFDIIEVTSFSTLALTLIIIISLNCVRPTRGYKGIIIAIPTSLLSTWRSSYTCHHFMAGLAKIRYYLYIYPLMTQVALLPLEMLASRNSITCIHIG